MPSTARMNRVKNALSPKRGPSYLYQVYAQGRGYDGKPVVIGPGGEVVPEVPPGCRSIVVTWVDNWRGDRTKPSWPTASVSVAVEVEGGDRVEQDAAAVPADQQILDDGTPAPMPEPAPPSRPDAWVVKRPPSGDVAMLADSIGFYSAKDRAERYSEFVSGMVSIAGHDDLASDLYPTRALALAAAETKLEALVAAWGDE